MDIQGHIIDNWLGKMTDKRPVLTVYDKSGMYESLLTIVTERGIKVINTTKDILTALEDACDYWMNELQAKPQARMMIYRKMERPTTDKARVDDPYTAMTQVGSIFPSGANDLYENMCKNFLQNKTKEIEELFRNGTASFTNINALQEGVSYPELENLTGGRSMVEITLNLLALTQTTSMAWMSEWRSFGQNHLPGLDCNGKSLNDIKKKLWQYLLFSEFSHDLPNNLPAELKTVAVSPKEYAENINTICNSIRNRNDLRDDYVEQAQNITSSLHLDTIFASATNLGKIVTFSFENRVEFELYIDYIHNGDFTNASLLLKKNKQSVWYEADKEVALFWNLVEQCERLLDGMRKAKADKHSLSELVKWYCENGYIIDNAFRKYQTLLSQSDATFPQINSLSNIVYTNYRIITEQIQQIYQQSVWDEGYKAMPINTNITSWKRNIEPLLKSRKKVVIIFADAFRYEMGKELTASMRNSYIAECTPAAAFVPTVTRFGMAALLPKADERMELKVDGNSKLQPVLDGKIIEIPTDRISYINENIPAHVKLQDVTSQEFASRNIEDDTNLLIIRSTKIDSAGENIQGVGLSEMESEMKVFIKDIRRCKSLGFDTLFIFADHGYMIQPKFQAGDNMASPVGNTVLTERRCIAGDLNQNETSWHYEPDKLGIKTDVFRFAFARQYGVYQKGKIYFHEGLSLQENIVPSLKVQLKDEKKKESFRLTITYKGKTEEIVRILRPKLELNISGDDNLFTPDICILRLVVQNATGKEVGHPVESSFYNETSDLITIPSGCTYVKQAVELDSDLQGDITILALDPETNATLASITLQTSFDF